MVAALISFIFYNQHLDQDGVMNINGALFMCISNMTFQNVLAVINVSVRCFMKPFTSNITESCNCQVVEKINGTNSAHHESGGKIKMLKRKIRN